MIADKRWEEYYRRMADGDVNSVLEKTITGVGDHDYLGAARRLYPDIWSFFKNSMGKVFIDGLQDYEKQYLLQMIMINTLFPKETNSILEIGSGNGRFAMMINDRGLIDYTCVDNFEMLKMAKKILEEWSNFKFIEADNFYFNGEDIQIKYDLMISNNCLSETPADYCKFVLDYACKNCKKVFIIDGKAEDKSFADGILNNLKDDFNKTEMFDYPVVPRLGLKVIYAEKDNK